MIRAAFLALAIGGAVMAAEPIPFTLDKLEPARVPSARRPTKAMPKETLAVFGQRGDKCDCFALRSDGRFFALSGPDQVVRMWDFEGLKLISTPKQIDSVVCLTFTPDRKSLVVGDASGNLRIWDKATERAPVARAAIPAHKEGPVWSLAVAPDGKRLASGGRDRTIRIWDVSKPKAASVASLDGHGDSVRALAFEPDGNRLYFAGGTDGSIRVWDMSDKPKAESTVMAGGRVVSLAITADGKLLASAGDAKSARVWSLKQGVPSDPVPMDTGGKSCTSISFSPDGRTLVGIVEQSETEDRVRLWNPDGTTIREFSWDSHVHAAGFTTDGHHLVVVAEFNALLVRIPK